MSGSARWNLGRLGEVRRSLVVTAVTVAIAGLVPVLGQVTASAAGTGSGVNYTLEGCRASSSAFPATGPFICLDSQYTTGNLGGGWNEFDLVPARVTLTSGSGSPGSFAFDVGVDNCSTATNPCTGTPGYDKLSLLTLNAAKSTSSCGTVGQATTGYTGGQLWREIDVSSMGTNQTCVYDFYARLAIGSHSYPGSSLHYNLTNDSHGPQGIGSKDVSIPVKQISPFGFSKTESASQGSSVVWNVSKTADTATNFTDTCASTAGQTVSVQVSWTKETTNGAITVDGAISIGNSAHRPLNIHVSDQLYDGPPPGVPATADGPAKVTDFTPFAALTSTTFHDVWSPPANVATSYNDIASASITDPVFLDTVNLPNATASHAVDTLAPTSGATAVITDIEQLTDSSDPASTTAATDYKFRVTAVSGAAGTLYSTFISPGNAGNVTYTAGASATLTTGPLTWVSSSQTSGSSVTFTKQIVPNNATTETATLHDTATIAPASQSTKTASASTAITSGAKVAIGVAKQTSVALDQPITFNFYAYGPGHGPASSGGDGVTAGTSPASVTIPVGSTGPVTTDPRITGLDPGVAYLIDEPAVAPFPPNSFTKTVNLPTCTSDQSVTNTAAPTTAQVKKSTVPTGSTVWTMTLTGVEAGGSTAVSDLSGGTSEVLNNVVANSANWSVFTSVLDQDGATYTITESALPSPATTDPWDNNNIVGDVSSDGSRVSYGTRSCSFTLNLTTDSGSTFECTFTNTERSDVKVVKTQDGAAPTLQFPFRLCPGSSLSACGSASPPTGSTTLKTNNGEIPVGTLDFGYKVPGSYVLCELGVPAGWHSTLQDSPYNGTLDGTTGNVCYAFTLGAGSDKTFALDNSSPKGNALTIGYWKHWNSVNVGASSGAGNKLMDTYLPKWLGPYLVDTAQKGVDVLSNPSMKYAENGLAAQLLAAKLNVASGALTCPALTDPITGAIHVADGLLNNISYAGPVGNTVGNKYPNRQLWVTTQSILDSYNNNTLC